MQSLISMSIIKVVMLGALSALAGSLITITIIKSSAPNNESPAIECPPPVPAHMQEDKGFERKKPIIEGQNKGF